MIEDYEKKQEIEKELKEKLLRRYEDNFSILREELKNEKGIDPSFIADEILREIRQIAFIYNYPWDDEIYIRYKGERFQWTNRIRRDIDTIFKILERKPSRNRMDEIYFFILLKSEISRERVNVLRRYAITKNFYVLDRATGEFLDVNLFNMMRFYRYFEEELRDNEQITRGLKKIQDFINLTFLERKELEEKIKAQKDIIEYSRKQKENVEDKMEYLEMLEIIRDLNLKEPLTPESDLSQIEEFKELWKTIISLLPFPHYLNVEYIPEAKAPRWEQFLKEVMDEKYHTAIKRFVGYGLYNDIYTHIPNIAIFVGDGSNGKGVFLSVVREILGEENYTVIAVQDISKRFRNLGLLNSMLNIAGDIPRKPLQDTGVLKMITGRDPILFEPKFKKPFKEIAKVKHIFSANELPKTGDKTYGFYRRWMIFIFPRIFTGDKADPKLTEKLLREKSGIFNWMLEGLREFLQDLDFNYPLSVNEIRDIYETASNSLLRFLQEECEEAPGEVISVEEFYRLYYSYCNEKNLTPLKSAGEVSKQITALASYVVRPSKPIWDSKSKGMKRVYKNIRVNYRPPEERDVLVEELGEIESYGEDNLIDVEFLQDYQFGRNHYRKGQRVQIEEDMAKSLSDKGIVKKLSIRMENKEDGGVRIQVLKNVGENIVKGAIPIDEGEGIYEVNLPMELLEKYERDGLIKILREGGA